MKKTTYLQAAITAAALLPTVTFASGYKLNEQSAAGMGTAHAGRAAMAEDASVVFYNPAAMTELDGPQLTAGFTYINGYGDFDGNATDASGLQPITGADDTDGYSDGGNYLGESFIPFFYYARPINDKFSVGLGVFVPFGTNTDYDSDFVGGAFADETSLSSIEIAPTFAYKVNDQLSVGGGVDIVYMEGTLSKFVDSIPTAVNPAYAGFENHFEVSGDDWGYGWNLGAYYKLNDTTTLAVAYRSEIEFTLEGDSEFANDFSFFDSGSGTIVDLGTIRPQASEVPITTPQSLTFSATHQLTDAVLLQAGATWTGWSSFEYFDVIATENLADATPDVSDIAANNGLGNGYIGHIVEKWSDVWALALGSTYQLNDKIALRAGYAYDQSPVSDEYRTARVPSSDRQWVTLGAQYVIDSNLSVDLAAGYLFMYPMSLEETNKDLNDETINVASTGQPVKVTGEYEIDVFGLSAQVNYKF
jgi:long-chain fatty acid transport protein